jgi:hypothetical protein
MTNTIKKMISKFQACIATMSSLGDDSLLLSYFLHCMEIMLDDINDEILEEFNAIIPPEEDKKLEDEPISAPDP